MNIDPPHSSPVGWIIKGGLVMKKWHKTLLITVSLLLAITAVIHAHVPYIEHEALRRWGPLAEGEDYSFEHPFIVPSGHIQQSRAVFAYLSRGDIDVYQYTLEEGESAMVMACGIPPSCAIYRNTYPATALIGPGLPDPEPNANLPFDIPDDCEDCGVLVKYQTKVPLREWNSRPVFALTEVPGTFISWFFPFDFDNDLIMNPIDVPGTYYIVIWNPDGSPCDYTANIGFEETFSEEDRFRVDTITPMYSDHRILHFPCIEVEGPYPF